MRRRLWLVGVVTALVCIAASPALAHKRYVVIRSRPGFVANHDSAQRSDALARHIFWAPLDRLIEQARRSG